MRELALHPVAGFVSFGVISESVGLLSVVQMQFVGNARRLTVADRMSIWLAIVETSRQITNLASFIIVHSFHFILNEGWTVLSLVVTSLADKQQIMKKSNFNDVFVEV
jgi:hypothetical protein